MFHTVQSYHSTITCCKILTHLEHLIRALASRNSNSTLFYHPKKQLYHYTIPFYNTSSIPKLYYFTILFKYYFLSLEANIKNIFWFDCALVCAHFLSLSLLSHFSVTYLGLIVLRSMLQLWIVGCGS